MPIDIAANATATDIATADQRQRQAPRCTPPWSRTAASSKLVFSSRKTGQNSDFSVDTSQLGAGTVLDEDSAYTRTGATLNASIKVDGGAEQNPESNVARERSSRACA